MTSSYAVEEAVGLNEIWLKLSQFFKARVPISVQMVIVNRTQSDIGLSTR